MKENKKSKGVIFWECCKCSKKDLPTKNYGGYFLCAKCGHKFINYLGVSDRQDITPELAADRYLLWF